MAKLVKVPILDPRLQQNIYAIHLWFESKSALYLGQKEDILTYDREIWTNRSDALELWDIGMLVEVPWHPKTRPDFVNIKLTKLATDYINSLRRSYEAGYEAAKDYYY